MLERALGRDSQDSPKRISLKLHGLKSLDLIVGSLVDPLGNEEDWFPATKMRSSANTTTVEDQRGLWSKCSKPFTGIEEHCLKGSLRG
jgi:hypothetical protein